MKLLRCAPLLLVLVPLGCEGLKMAVQEPVASSPSTPITLKGKVATMGAMTLTRTKGGAITTFSGSAGPWGGEKIKQNFDYETSDGWAGSCAFATGNQSIGPFAIPPSGGMMCSIQKGDETWTLDLKAVMDGGRRLVGTYSNGTTTIDVRMSRELQGGGLPIFMGYNLSIGGAPVGAVQAAGNRALWLLDGAEGAEAIRASVGAYVFSFMAVQQATS